ncbi:LppC family lipoprotein [Thiorhodococcus drewsii AZ1]|uniref:LppC family lipoprotein n=1 Tax=Thiorhodococcus drewsii AZ1 TaxID=765913 RepID=G2E034_9GAMM|nr:penicillin-binding protein activator [Thiorhodococcus drewsii]EGV32073.1 LppC family lipoprotein [Thiorhodococcus drewsii AZ1]
MPKHCVARTSLSITYWLTAIIAAILLTACAVNPTFDEAQILAPVARTDLDRAAAAERQGKQREAADIYLQLAPRSPQPARAQLQLKALHAYLSAGRTSEAAKLVATLSAAPLTSLQHQLLRLEQADLALLSNHPKEAIAHLERMRSNALPKTFQVRRLGTLAFAQRLADRPIAAAESLAQLDRVLNGEDARLANQVSLVSALASLPQARLQTLARNGSGAMKGWAGAALALKGANASPERLKSSYRTWKDAHSGHPASPDLGNAYAEMLTGGYTDGDRVSVMLPRNGRFAAAAKAVREGIEAAKRADTSNRTPTLKFADSTNATRVTSLHAKAVQSGADYVIGPLEKPAVDALLRKRYLPLPTLALNEATHGDRRAENLFQFALSPENEATEAANTAFTMGSRRALILYPQGAWGNRMATAFRHQWRNLGGTLLGQATYNPRRSSYAATLRKLMADSSADLLFLVATAEPARRIYPHIQSLAPAGLKVVATSHVYSGRFDPARDRPLIGLYFVDIPWMLDRNADGPLSRQRLMGTSMSVAGPLARLYAMGIDAYRLAPHLTEMSRNRGAFYPGQTGGLSMDPLGRIKRQLTLARFTAQGPRPADEAPD